MPLQFFKRLRAVAPLLVLGISAEAQQTPANPSPLFYGTPITLEAARKVVVAATAEAKKQNLYMVFAVVDSGSNLVLLERADGAQLGSIRIAQAKAHTALDLRRPTKTLQENVAKGGDNLRFLSMPDVITVQGGELLVANGKIIGALGVSGGTSDQDEAVALVGIAAVGGK